MKMTSLKIFVAGSNRGIGFELVKQMVEKLKPAKIFATYRTEDKSKELLEFASKNSEIFPLQLDITDDKKYPEIVRLVDKETKGSGLNLLVVNAGISSDKPQSLDNITKDILMKHFEVNSVSPLLLSRALLPLLAQGSAGNPSGPLGINRGAIINISSILGSISLVSGTRGGAYAYRSSKAALNMLTRELSLDALEKNVLAAVVHPGWVKTEMGGPKAPLSVEQSASSIINLLINLNKSHNGQFLNAQESPPQLQW